MGWWARLAPVRGRRGGVPSALKSSSSASSPPALLWGVYLLVTLFFYFADAFSADRRNNAMLFWKSMPVSDLKMLTSKMLAGLAVLPGADLRRRDG